MPDNIEAIKTDIDKLFLLYYPTYILPPLGVHLRVKPPTDRLEAKDPAQKLADADTCKLHAIDVDIIDINEQAKRMEANPRKFRNVLGGIRPTSTRTLRRLYEGMRPS